MFQIATGAVYLAGAGAIIIGGLYWSRGTTMGAWWAMILGALVMLGSIAIRQIEARLNVQVLSQPNPQIVSVVAMAVALVTYVVVSLLTCRQPFNLEKMLHRGIYSDSPTANTSKTGAGPRKSWVQRFGVVINSEFSRGDKILSLASLVWFGFWFTLALSVTIYCSWQSFSDGAWSRFWQGYCYLYAAIGAIMTLWIGWGGIKDLKYMLHMLRTAKRDFADDGRVEDSSRQQDTRPGTLLTAQKATESEHSVA